MNVLTGPLLYVPSGRDVQSEAVTGIPEMAAAVATATGATGIAPVPAAVTACRNFLRNDVKRNLLRSVRARLLADRPPPGGKRDMLDVYDQLCGFLVNPGFLDAINALVDHGSYAALTPIGEHIEKHLVLPDTADREAIVEVIDSALVDGVPRAQKNAQSATGVATRLHADRVIAKLDANGRSLASEVSALSDKVASLGTLLQPQPILDLDELAVWTRKTMRALKRRDAVGCAWLVGLLSDPPSSERVIAAIDRWPAELESGSEDLLFAVVRHAEAVGAWDRASFVWQRQAERAAGAARADHYARAAIDAGMAGQEARREAMLALAFDADLSSVRATLEALDPDLAPEAKLEALKSLESDDLPLECLLECHRAREYLVLNRLEDAETHLTKARALSGDEVGVRVAEVNLTIEWARRALRERMASSADKLRAAQSAALDLREELLPMKRYAETVRLLMLAAEVDGFLFDFSAMSQLLRSATPEELDSPEGPGILAGAALRSGDRMLAHAFALARPDDLTCRRVRAALDAEDPDSPRRAEALEDLTTMALAGGEESTLAALARLQGGAIRPQADWDQHVADVLVGDGYENVAVELHVATLLYAERPIAAGMLLDDLPDEAWVAELHVRIMGFRKRRVALADAAEALLRHAPGPKQRLLAAQAFSDAGAAEPARRELATVAHDAAAPPLVRSDAYNSLIGVLVRQQEWKIAQEAIEGWQRVLTENGLWDDRINDARMHVGSGLATLAADRRD